MLYEIECVAWNNETLYGMSVAENGLGYWCRKCSYKIFSVLENIFGQNVFNIIFKKIFAQNGADINFIMLR